MPHESQATDTPIPRRALLAAGLALLGGAPPLVRAGRGQDSGAQARTVKGLYLSYHGVGDRTIRGRVFDLLDRTELNAVVIDVKGDEGYVPYDSQVPLAREAGATGRVRVHDFDEIIARLKAKGLYLIARIVVFKDNVLARHRPEWAVTDARTGTLWLDAERLAWLDPFEDAAWSYAIAIASEAARKGFDEIQLDYLRFPTEGHLGAARYRRSSTSASREHAVVSFLERARAALRPVGALLALDVFGYIAFNVDDTGIGQRIETLAPRVDVLCPMAYPSSYHLGIPGYRNPVAHPYEIVFETVRRARERTAGTRVQVRPWIQNFRDYAFDRRPFEAAEVQAQMKAALDAGAPGWMLWHPQNRYTVEALGPKPAPGPPSEGARSP
jgi:hypothetical protein